MLLSHHILNMFSYYLDFEPRDSTREIDYACFVASSVPPNTIQIFLLHMLVLFHESCLGTFILADAFERV